MTSPTESYALQRITGAIMVPLSIWILFFLVQALGGILFGDPEEYLLSIEYIFGNKQSIASIIAFMVCSLYHGVLGLQSIIRDYIACDVMKKVTNTLVITGAFGAVVYLSVFLLTFYSDLS